MLSYRIFHDFFHERNPDRRKYREARAHVHFEGSHFLSYSTEIGYIYKAGRNREYLFMADAYFSATTSRHLGNLRRSCPLPIIDVPFEWGDDFTHRSAKDICAELKKRFLAYLLNAELPPYARRHEYINAAAQFELFLEATKRKIRPSQRAEIESRLALYEDTPENKARRAKQAAAKAAATRKKHEEFRKEVEEIISRNDLSSWTDKARFAFYSYCDENRKLRKYLDKLYPGYSWVWLEDKTAKTSKGISIPVRLFKRTLSKFLNGKLKVKDPVGVYSVSAIADEYIRIGCHIISVQNILDLVKDIEGTIGNGA